MQADALADADAESTDFRGRPRLLDPDADGGFILSCGDSELKQRRNHDVLQTTNETADGKLMIDEPYDRGSDDLPGPVERHVPTAIAVDEIDAELAERFPCGDQILFAVRPSAKGNDRRGCRQDRAPTATR